MKPTTQEDFPYPPIICSRILQTLDCEKRFGVPYGTRSPFAFAFRDHEFRKPGNRSYKYYMALRRCRNIKEYRQHVTELYQDCDIDIEVNGESRKFPIQMVPISPEDHKALNTISMKNKFPNLAPPEVPLVFLGTLPAPRLLGSPPTGRYRTEFVTEILTNKIIDFGIIVPETEVELGIRYLGTEISRNLAPVESTLSFAGEIGKRLKSIINKPIAISLRGTMADNQAICDDAFRVPASCENFWESREDSYWPTMDMDIDIFCGCEDFEEIYKNLQEPVLFVDVNAKVSGLRVVGEVHPKEYQNKTCQRHVDIYLMTDEWVFSSIQRHLHLGLEQPWAYYYATSYPLLFDDWEEFINSLYKHMSLI